MFQDLSMLDYCLMAMNRKPLTPLSPTKVEKVKMETPSIPFETKPLTNQTFVEYEEEA